MKERLKDAAVWACFGLVVAGLCFIAFGCTTTSSNTPQTFSQLAATAEAADDAVIVAATALLNAGTITSSQAKRVLT
jgi:hypothetical protein